MIANRKIFRIFEIFSMPMMPHHIAMMQAQGGPPKPLFPSAIPTSSPGASIVGADFKPISSGTVLLWCKMVLY